MAQTLASPPVQGTAATAAASRSGTETSPGRTPNRWATLAVLCLSLLVIVVDTTIVNVALPTLARQLQATTSGLQWIVDGYTLPFAALLMLAGTLADRYGRRRALAGGLAVFAAGSLAAALTHTTAELITARAIMGAAAAFIMPATLSLLTSVFTNPAERAKAIGLWTAVSGLGVAIGPTAGGWLLAHFSWDAIFLVNLPVAGVALLASRWLVPASRAPQARRLDLAGAALSAAGLGMLTYTLIQAPESGWTSAATLGRAAAAVALLAAFGLWERHSPEPMLPLALLRDRRFSAAAAAITLLFFALGSAVFLLTQVYQFVLGYSPLAAGVRALPSALALAAASPLGAQLAQRLGTRVPVVAGLITLAAGLGLFATATARSGYPHYVTAMVIASAGIGLAMAPATESVMNTLPRQLAGIGSAVNDTARNLGSVLGVAVAGSVTASVYASRMTAASAGGHSALAASQSMGAAASLAAHAGGTRGAFLLHTASAAFVSGVDRSVLIAAVLAVAGAIGAAYALRGHGARPAAQD